ncbi:MAG: tRNA (5-methylaminomethyl-2-thiouridine)(34)-methyltransferase MnmD [Flavobacteriales bacterium]|nr:tRNA (5-methylaminomethyl-2-thiouridine)(34)-methyltransferase MnmD [Flavobacteriales bacterium]MCB9334771.1 tRNA (5-methylaminomethyl-2-thiouridine)(34)-methyltransferase MnmD [Flavobacteriales bacterium]
MLKSLHIKNTSDGSHTLYVPELDETYHSIHGAVQEAKHVFINNGLEYFKGLKKFSVFEVGFGTGLNTILTKLYAEKNQVEINYHTIESFPISLEIIEKLNYAQEINGIEKEDFLKIHEISWGENHQLSAYFKLTKVHDRIQGYETDRKFDVIFYDAFGPRAQKEMWEKSIFEKMFSLLNSDGILVTYCAKGQVKRNLKEVGFVVETLPGPPGKREMTRAIKEQL